MKGSLKFQLMVGFNLVILLMVTMMGVALALVMRSELLRRAQDSLMVSLAESSNTLDYFYSVYLAKSDTAFLDLELNELLTRESQGLGERIAQRRVIMEKLARMVTFDLRYPEVRNSYYFGGSTRVRLYVRNRTLVNEVDFFPYEEIYHTAAFQNLMASAHMFSWDADEAVGGVPYVAFSRRLLNMETFEDIALMKVLLPTARVRNILLQNANSDVAAFVYSDASFGPIVGGGAAQVQQQLTSGDIEGSLGRVIEVHSGGQVHLVSTVASDLTGWNLTYAVPKALVVRSTRTVMALTATACVITIFLGVLASTLISSGITRHIDLLVLKTRRVAAGNLEIDEALRDTGSNEISQLSRAFDTMTQEILALHQKEMTTRLRINEVRAELLQEQINPHLLYNTLSMIKLVAKRDDQQETFELAEGLVNFYKGVLNRGSLVAPIKRELFMVRNFVETTCKVYGLRIGLNLRIPTAVEKLYTVKLFLQPLVENAVLHGIRPGGFGILDISAVLEGNSIVFTIVDDGIGIDDGVLEAMQTAMGGGDAPGRRQYGGFGVLNVYKRMKLFFGEAGNMCICSKAGEGTAITLTIPAFTREDIDRWLQERQIGGL